MTALERDGLVRVWAQHGHDGLPQRAGFPPQRVLEVYNSWQGMEGDPHREEMGRLERAGKESELVVALGCPGPGPALNLALAASMDRTAAHLGILAIGSAGWQGGPQPVLALHCTPERGLRLLLEALQLETSVTRSVQSAVCTANMPSCAAAECRAWFAACTAPQRSCRTTRGAGALRVS